MGRCEMHALRQFSAAVATSLDVSEAELYQYAVDRRGKPLWLAFACLLQRFERALLHRGRRRRELCEYLRDEARRVVDGAVAGELREPAEGGAADGRRPAVKQRVERPR